MSMLTLRSECKSFFRHSVHCLSLAPPQRYKSCPSNLSITYFAIIQTDLEFTVFVLVSPVKRPIKLECVDIVSVVEVLDLRGYSTTTPYKLRAIVCYRFYRTDLDIYDMVKVSIGTVTLIGPIFLIISTLLTEHTVYSFKFTRSYFSP